MLLRAGAIAFASAFLFIFAGIADAQERVRVRGAIEKFEGNVLTVKTREGPVVTIKLADNFTVGGLVPAKFEDIKDNSYVGVAALPLPDGKLRAIEIFIFPEALRGASEGHIPWDLVPESTMTNATVTGIVRTEGNALVLKYKDGEKTILIPPGIPIVTGAAADKSELKAGAKIFIAYATKQPDGTLSAARVAVGLNGLTPPM